MPISNPLINVAFGRDTVTVKDNGPGMNFEMLERAVRAGWSSQQELDSLGLYGMGFNIATAVLGAMTTIWTTQSGDPEWYGTEIDLQKLSQSGQFGLPRKIRDKSDHNSSGTIVEITRLKSEHKENLNNAGWVRVNITERLRKVYSTMLRDKNPQPIKFSLQLNNKKVPAREHCVWPSDWEVFRTREGNVRPVQEIDEDFGTRYRNRKTGETFDTPDGIPEEDLVEIPQRVYGWIGIQRYGDEKEYGFDLIRNGRKIELDCKDFFSWEDAEGSQIFEYPIDDIRKRLGRIVGEIHLDHGYVYYTKDHFERNHVSWGHIERAIRNNEPLTKRNDLGYGNTVNDSPLGVLHRTFRRNSPQSNSGQGWWDILYFKENDVAKQWADEWRKNTPEYRDDSKWKSKLRGYDAPPASDQGMGDGTAGDGDDDTSAAPVDDPILGLGTGNPADVTPPGSLEISATGQGGVTSNGESSGSNSIITPASGPASVPINDLKLHIVGVGLRGTTYEVEAFAIEAAPSSASTLPWYTQPTARGVYEVYVNTNHPAFNSTTLQVRDAVLAEMAYIITKEEDAQASSNEAVSFSEMLVSLREKFSNTDSLDMSQLSRDIEQIRKSLVRRFAAQDSSAQRRIVDRLPTADVQSVELAAAQGATTFPITDYLKMAHLVYLLDNDAETLFAAGCFNRPWTPDLIASNSTLLQAHRERMVRILSPLFSTLAEYGVSTSGESTKQTLSYVRASINMLRAFLNGDNAQ